MKKFSENVNLFVNKKNNYKKTDFKKKYVFLSINFTFIKPFFISKQ